MIMRLVPKIAANSNHSMYEGNANSASYTEARSHHYIGIGSMGYMDASTPPTQWYSWKSTQRLDQLPIHSYKPATTKR